MPRFNPNHSTRGSALALAVRRLSGICRVCNQPRGNYHDDARCAAEWLRRCDEEGREKQGGYRS
jgi:hypothetical protein